MSSIHLTENKVSKKNLLTIVIIRKKIILFLFEVNINLSHIHELNGGDFGTPGLILVRNASIEWEGNYYSLLSFNKNKVTKVIYTEEQRMTLINKNDSKIDLETPERVEFGTSFWVNCSTNWTNNDYFMILSKDNQEFYRFNGKSE